MKISELMEFLNELQNNNIDTVEFGVSDENGDWHEFKIDELIAEEGLIAFEENDDYLKQTRGGLLEALNELEHMSRQFQEIASDALYNHSEELRRAESLE